VGRVQEVLRKGSRAHPTHLEYGDDPRCIGKLDALRGDEYYEAMDAVFAEVERVLRDRRYLALYVSDSFKKGEGFAAIGCELYALLRKRFKPVEHVCVVRGNRTLEKPNFHRAAAEGNFFLRGFNHLLIFKKQHEDSAGAKARPRPRPE
jgi:hypothetical protein